MIEVTISDAGTDRVLASAEADTPADAVYAARTLWNESLNGFAYERRIVRFFVDGKMVRQVLRYGDLG